jgi:hypothetical protein
LDDFKKEKTKIMSNLFANNSPGPGYGSLAGGVGSVSSMTILDNASGVIASLLDKGIQMVQCAHAIYNFATDGGATGVITPKLTASIPAGAICFLSFVNAPSAPVGSGNISVGTSAGSSATAVLGATAYNNGMFATDIATIGAITTAAMVKMTAQGNITFTLSGTLTAGVVEAFIIFVMPQNL